MTDAPERIWAMAPHIGEYFADPPVNSEDQRFLTEYVRADLATAAAPVVKWPDVFHDEQIRIWAEEMIFDIENIIKPISEYHQKVDVYVTIRAAIKELCEKIRTHSALQLSETADEALIRSLAALDHHLDHTKTVDEVDQLTIRKALARIRTQPAQQEDRDDG